MAILRIAHSVPDHHAHFSSWQSRGTPLPTTRFPGTPVANANGHILGKNNHLLKALNVFSAELSFVSVQIALKKL